MLWRVTGLPFRYPLDSILLGTTTQNIFGDQVAGFTALLVFFCASSIDLPREVAKSLLGGFKSPVDRVLSDVVYWGPDSIGSTIGLW